MIQRKYLQSVQLTSETEQEYYDGTRDMIKENGISDAMYFINEVAPGISRDKIQIEKSRWLELMRLAVKDYLDIAFGTR